MKVSFQLKSHLRIQTPSLFRSSRLHSLLLKVIFTSSLGIAPPHLSEAAPSILHLSYLSIQNKATQHSSLLAATNSERRAAEAKRKAQFARFFPTLGVDISGRWVSEVPELELSPSNSVTFGDHFNYSLGLGVQWTLWDSLANYHHWKGAQALEAQKKAEIQSTALRTELETSLAYFQVLLSATQLKSVLEALELSRFQYQDIQQRVRSGTASKLDALSAQREVLELESQLFLVESEVVRTLQTLFSFTGELDQYDLTRPIIDPQNLAIQKNATLVILTEPISQLVELFDAMRLLDSPPSSQHPQIAAGRLQSEFLERSARSLSSQHGPLIRVHARTSYEYPNGPVLDPTHQYAIGVTLTMSLFESGRILHETAEKRSLAEATTQRTEHKRLNLLQEWNGFRTHILALRNQQTVSKQSALESEEIAQLTFQSYRHGRMNYLDVQNANVRALHAKLRAAQLEIQILIALAQLKSLNGGSSHEG